MKEGYDGKEKIIGAATMRYHERMVMLSVIDELWKDHLLSMDHLKEGIGLRGYGQKDPLVEYKRESFDMFEAMMLKFQEDTVRFLLRMQILGPDGQPVDGAPRINRDGSQGAARGQRRGSSDDRCRSRARSPSPRGSPLRRSMRWRRSFCARSSASLKRPAQLSAETQASPRNGAPARRLGATTPAPAGSGKKYKKCHGAEK